MAGSSCWHFPIVSCSRADQRRGDGPVSAFCRRTAYAQSSPSEPRSRWYQRSRMKNKRNMAQNF